MASLLDRVVSLAAPPLCWSCRGPARPGNPLCGECRRSLRRLGAEPVTLAGIEVWAPLAYEGAARALVRALKYRGASTLAGPMAAQIAANAPLELFEARGGSRQGSLPAPAALVPVPLHPARLRRRGFNQAELLAEALARRTGLAMCDCLQRRGAGIRQVGRDREQRLAGPAGAVAQIPGRPLPAHVVLVDDVATTGATLAACAAALLACGTHSVTAVTFARTPGR